MKALCNSFIIVLFLTACTSLNVPSVDTFNKKLAVGYTTVTSVRESATVLLNLKKISAEDGKNILEQTNIARAGLDVARELSTKDLTAAESKLAAISTILQALQTYLRSIQ
jgi:hypothetical protein